LYIVIFPYMHIMYFDQIHPFITFSYSPPLKNNLNRFHYSISIHLYKVLQSYSSSFTISFHLPSLWFPLKQSPHFTFADTELWDQVCAPRIWYYGAECANKTRTGSDLKCVVLMTLTLPVGFCVMVVTMWNVGMQWCVCHCWGKTWMGSGREVTGSNRWFER
jgi:hypothetical protein